MEFNMVFHEGRNEEVGVIVAVLEAVLNFELVIFKSSCDKLLGKQLPFDQEVID